MFDVGGPELILILLAVIVLFGPKKAPEMIQMIRKGLRHVRKAQSQFSAQMDDISSEVKDIVDIDAVKDLKNDFHVLKTRPPSVDKHKERPRSVPRDNETGGEELSDEINTAYGLANIENGIADEHHEENKPETLQKPDPATHSINEISGRATGGLEKPNLQ